MKAVVIDAFGDASVLRLAEVNRPIPGPRDVLIKIMCASVNPIDWKERAGIFAQGERARTFTFPHILGFDASGVVEAVGADVRTLSVGQRVVTCSDGPGTWGTYAEYVTVRADRAGPMPRSQDFAEAAAYPLAALTAWQDLFAAEKGHLSAGQSVLFHGAAGGLGSYGVQFAKHAGLKTAATCRTENVDHVRRLGADCVIDYRREDIAAALRAWRPQGVDVVIDAVGPETLPQALDLLRPGGRLVSVATLTQDGDIAALKAVAESRGFARIWAIMAFDGVDRQLAEIAGLFDRGCITSPPITVLPIDQVGEAHRLVETGHVRGKIVLRVNGAFR